MGPYETRINSQYRNQLSDVKKAIEKQTAMGEDRFFVSLGKYVRMPKYDNDTLPHWSHPFVMGGTVYMDARPFMNKVGGIKNHVEYDLMRRRAVLEYLWKDDPEIFERLMPDMVVVFAEWYTGGISSRYNASEVDRSRFKVVAASYYVWLILTQVQNGKVSKEDVRNITAKILSRTGGMPANYVFDVLNDMDTLELLEGAYPDIDRLARNTKAMATFDMGDFTAIAAMQLMSSGSWIGVNNVMLSAMALEHPPLFLVLIAGSHAISGYRNKTRIGRAVNSMGRKINPESLNTTLIRLVDEYAAVIRTS
jgi:hypothetical protein